MPSAAAVGCCRRWTPFVRTSAGASVPARCRGSAWLGGASPLSMRKATAAQPTAPLPMPAVKPEIHAPTASYQFSVKQPSLGVFFQCYFTSNKLPHWLLCLAQTRGLDPQSGQPRCRRSSVQRWLLCRSQPDRCRDDPLTVDVAVAPVSVSMSFHSDQFVARHADVLVLAASMEPPLRATAYGAPLATV